MVRNIEGHGLRIINLPPIFGPTSCPFASTTAGSTPKNGRVALPGLVGVAPGGGVIMIVPVPGCHHGPTMGQREARRVLWYHIQAARLIGPPDGPDNGGDD